VDLNHICKTSFFSSCAHPPTFFVTHLCLLLISCCVAACCCCFCVFHVFCLNSTTTFWFLLFGLLLRKHKERNTKKAEQMLCSRVSFFFCWLWSSKDGKVSTKMSTLTSLWRQLKRTCFLRSDLLILNFSLG